MAEYSIRYASEPDAQGIVDVLHAAFVEFRPLYTPEGFAVTTPGAGVICQRMKEGPIWVAIAESQIAGTASAVSKGKSLYVRGMAVHPLFRERGLARTLLRYIEGFAMSGEYERLTLSTTPFLTIAIKLYESFGFYRSEEGPHDLHGTPLFTMAKKL